MEGDDNVQYLFTWVGVKLSKSRRQREEISVPDSQKKGRDKLHRETKTQ